MSPEERGLLRIIAEYAAAYPGQKWFNIKDLQRVYIERCDEDRFTAAELRRSFDAALRALEQRGLARQDGDRIGPA